MEKKYSVFIMANSAPVLFIGFSNNLLRTVYEFKYEVEPDSFVVRNKLNKLVYYELFDDRSQAIIREKQLKNMDQQSKINIIKATNPNMRNLFDDIEDNIEKK